MARRCRPNLSRTGTKKLLFCLCARLRNPTPSVDNFDGAHYPDQGNCSMPSHEELFKRLQDLAAIKALINTTEDLYLECKIWPPKEEDRQRTVAKALCGFANADGGVLVIGMMAKAGPNKDDPDIIQKAQPVADALAVKSRIENLVGQLVEPGLEGVQAAPIYDTPDSKSGFVLVDVPPTEGFPCRSRKDWKFYLRISAGTFPMEYFQIADMFGKRRRPVLTLFVEEGEIRSDPGATMERLFTIGIENRGRGAAKFPSMRFRRTPGINIFPFPIRASHFDTPKFCLGYSRIGGHRTHAGRLLVQRKP